MMAMDERIRILQHTYSYVLADTARQLGQEGVLDRVTSRKRQEQMATGAAKADQMGITSAEQVFTRLSDIFGCANWDISPFGDGFAASTKGCVLCGQAKRLDAPSPCRLYCLDPMEGMVKGLRPKAEFVVKTTLWSGDECRIEVTGCDVAS